MTSEVIDFPKSKACKARIPIARGLRAFELGCVDRAVLGLKRALLKGIYDVEDIGVADVPEEFLQRARALPRARAR